MRRERKEIFKKMNEIEKAQMIERQLACGYSATDFGYEDEYQSEIDNLYDELAATYGLSPKEYWEKEFEIGDMLFKTGVLQYEAFPNPAMYV